MATPPPIRPVCASPSQVTRGAHALHARLTPCCAMCCCCSALQAAQLPTGDATGQPAARRADGGAHAQQQRAPCVRAAMDASRALCACRRQALASIRPGLLYVRQLGRCPCHALPVGDARPAHRPKLLGADLPLPACAPPVLLTCAQGRPAQEFDLEHFTDSEEEQPYIEMVSSTAALMSALSCVPRCRRGSHGFLTPHIRIRSVVHTQCDPGLRLDHADSASASESMGPSACVLACVCAAGLGVRCVGAQGRVQPARS